jgi:hypothetical protein
MLTVGPSDDVDPINRVGVATGERVGNGLGGETTVAVLMNVLVVVSVLETRPVVCTLV